MFPERGDAESLVDALDEGLSGRRPLAEALAEYERRRNEASAADYRENLHLASFQPPPAETYRLRAAIRNDAEATRQFFLARQQMIPPECFFNRDNLQRLLGTVPDGRPRGLAYGVDCARDSTHDAEPTPTREHDGQTTRGVVRRAIAASWCLLLVLCAPALALAQARPAAADISGRVTDESGAILPSATVTVVNTDTNAGHTVHT